MSFRGINVKPENQVELPFSLTTPMRTDCPCLRSLHDRDGVRGIFNYNLISVLYHSSDNVESLKTCIQDAEGDRELVEFFNGILENNLEAVQRAREMLLPRFQGEQE